MHRNDSLCQDKSVIRYRNHDLMRLLEVAVELIGGHREVELESQNDDEKITVRLRAW
jgi:hypothetical protein